MSKGEKKTHDMRKKLEALRAKNAEGAQKLAAINARTADLHKQLVEQLKTGTGTANDDLKKTVNELGAKIAETEMHTKSIQHALRGEDITADEHGQDSPQHEAARKRTEYVAKMADWDESKHKRADDGKFGEGGGGGGGGDKHRDAEHASQSNNEMPKENKKAQARRADIISKSKPAKEQEYYHGTAASNVESILKDGIQPTDNTMGFHAAFAGGEGLAFSYGAGSAAAHNDDHVAMVILKGGKDSGLLNPPGADNIAYKPGAIHPSQIDRIEIFHKDAGKNDKPVKVIRPEKKIA